jgi:hypothetical protein
VRSVILVIALAFFSGHLSAACQNSSFQGVFSALVTGSFVTPPSGIPGGPTARIGRVTPDGLGNTHIDAVLSLDGIIQPESYPGVYTINPDCTATVVLQVQFPGVGAVPFTFMGMLVNGGLNMELILVNPQGADVRISLRKETATSCSNASLSGDYAIQMSGAVVFQFGLPTGIFARVGKTTFDGNGKFTGSVQTDYNGYIVPETLTGTYAVLSDCTFTVNFLLVEPIKLSGVLSNVLNGAYIIQSAPEGSVITGSLTSVQASAVPLVRIEPGQSRR